MCCQRGQLPRREKPARLPVAGYRDIQPAPPPVLPALAFGLSLFGTFLTRSGIIQSIHSFTQSSIGPWFLGFICVAAAFSTAAITFG